MWLAPFSEKKTLARQLHYSLGYPFSSQHHTMDAELNPHSLMSFQSQFLHYDRSFFSHSGKLYTEFKILNYKIRYTTSGSYKRN